MTSPSRFPPASDSCTVGLQLKSKAPNWRIVVVVGCDRSQAIIIVLVVTAVASECDVHGTRLRKPDAAETQ